MDTRIRDFRRACGQPERDLRAGAVRAAFGAISNEIENMRRLPPGKMMDADTHLTFVQY